MMTAQYVPNERRIPVLRETDLICLAPGCGRPSRTRGLCKKHYRRARKAGTLDIIQPPGRSARERFQHFLGPKDPITKCVPWIGAKQSTGYGVFKVDGSMILAHRLAWEFANGPIPEGLYVLHDCDHPNCCNPGHLQTGTNADNRADCCRKGRQSKGEKHGLTLRGEKNGSAKLTEAQVLDIFASTESGVDLAARYGVSQATISAICTGKTWAWLSEDAQ